MSVTTRSGCIGLLHVGPQLMPAGLLVTVPVRSFETFRVNVEAGGGVIVNVNAFDATAPGFTTVT